MGKEREGVEAGWALTEQTRGECLPGVCGGYSPAQEETRFVGADEKVPADAVPGLRVPEKGQQAADSTIQTGKVGTPFRAIGKGGARASYDPRRPENETFRTVSAEGDVAASGSYAGISRDGEGNGQAWVRGDGYVINGRTGERIEMGVVHEDTTNTFRLTDRHGSPFAVADANGNLTPLRTGLPDGEGSIRIIGREIQIPGKPKGTFGRDDFNISAPEITYRGRDGHGNSGKFVWDGTGWGRLAEGYVVTGQGPKKNDGTASWSAGIPSVNTNSPFLTADRTRPSTGT